MYCIDWVVSAAQCTATLFKIYCALPNLGTSITKTWIYRLNFAQRPIFQVWGSLTSLKSQTRDLQLNVPLGGLLLLKKMHRPQPDFSPQTLDPEASSLTRDYRGRLIKNLRIVELNITHLNEINYRNVWKIKL